MSTHRWTTWTWPAALLLSCSAQAGQLGIAVEQVRSDRGTIMIGLYDNAQAFDRAVGSVDSKALLIEPGRFAAITVRASAAKGTIVTFSDVRPGRYAVIAFQDENDNAKLDRNIFGVPTEPYGFSNNVRGLFGAPAFDRAAVAVDGSQSLIRIILANP